MLFLNPGEPSSSKRKSVSNDTTNQTWNVTFDHYQPPYSWGTGVLPDLALLLRTVLAGTRNARAGGRAIYVIRENSVVRPKLRRS